MHEEMKYQICTKCKGDPQPLDEEHFHRDKSSKTGFIKWCKKCQNNYYLDSRKHKWDNPKPKVIVTDFDKACRADELRRYQVVSPSICQDAF